MNSAILKLETAIPRRFPQRVRRGPASPIENRPEMFLIFASINQSLRARNSYALELDPHAHDDDKLTRIVARLGSLCDLDAHAPTFLASIATRCVAWLQSFSLSEKAVMELIAQERLRQRQLFRDRKFVACCWHPHTAAPRKLRILTEEVGEVAHAIDQLELFGPSKQRLVNLKKELVQVAAVAVAWLESLQPQPNV